MRCIEKTLCSPIRCDSVGELGSFFGPVTTSVGGEIRDRNGLDSSDTVRLVTLDKINEKTTTEEKYPKIYQFTGARENDMPYGLREKFLSFQIILFSALLPKWTGHRQLKSRRPVPGAAQDRALPGRAKEEDGGDRSKQIIWSSFAGCDGFCARLPEFLRHLILPPFQICCVQCSTTFRTSCTSSESYFEEKTRLDCPGDFDWTNTRSRIGTRTAR